MRESTKEIFEKHEIRKTGKQKAAFRKFIGEKAEALGYSSHVESGSFGARNVVVGDPDGARVVFGAHYDTCPRLFMPNFITPKNILVYILYQILLAVVVVAIPIIALRIIIELAAPLVGIVGDNLFLIKHFASLLWCIVAVYLLMAGPANKHTAHDNTSGVTTLVSIMEDIPEEMRSSVAFVFFDLEEVGLIGSSSFAGRHKAVMKDKLLVNFDCVSDGENIIFALRHGAREYEGVIREAYKPEGGFKVEVLSRGVIYPSDQASFKKGVGVAALKRGKFDILYMDRIHTARDTVFMEENIEFLARGSIELTRLLMD